MGNDHATSGGAAGKSWLLGACGACGLRPVPARRGGCSDMEGGLSSGHGEAVSTTVAVDTASVDRMVRW